VRPWRSLERRTLLDTPPWLVAGDEVLELPDGRVIDRFNWVRTADWTAVAAFTDAGTLVRPMPAPAPPS